MTSCMVGQGKDIGLWCHEAAELARGDGVEFGARILTVLRSNNKLSV